MLGGHDHADSALLFGQKPLEQSPFQDEDPRRVRRHVARGYGSPDPWATTGRSAGRWCIGKERCLRSS